MDQPTIAGIATLGIPLLIVGLLFRRAMAIFLFYVALVVVGIGYLASTGAIADIGNFALETIGVRGTDTVPMVPPAEKMPAPAPAP
jgi:hypothetical protein